MKSATRSAAPVATVWIPLAAELMDANVADSELAPVLLRELPSEVRFFSCFTVRFEHDLDLSVGLKAFLKAAW